MSLLQMLCRRSDGPPEDPEVIAVRGRYPRGTTVSRPLYASSPARSWTGGWAARASSGPPVGVKVSPSVGKPSALAGAWTAGEHDSGEDRDAKGALGRILVPSGDFDHSDDR